MFTQYPGRNAPRKDPGLPNPPSHDRRCEVTDEQLSAELKKWTGSTPALQPVGELLDRHWEAGFAYARLCTDGAPSAGMLTTAAFTRLFGETLRQNGPTSAWRPQLLVTVRRIAAEWDNDRRNELLHPELRSGPDGTERAGAQPRERLPVQDDPDADEHERHEQVAEGDLERAAGLRRPAEQPQLEAEEGGIRDQHRDEQRVRA